MLQKWIQTFIRYIDFYEEYHSEKVNQIIHLIGIPVVYWTVLMILSHPAISYRIFPEIEAGVLLQACLQINITFFVVITYIFCYALFTPRLTPVYIVVFLFLGWSSNLVNLLSDNVLWFAIPLHVAGWTAQFIGHGFFEKRKPALLDNIVQAFLVAPWFGLHELFGLRKFTPSPEPRPN